MKISKIALYISILFTSINIAQTKNSSNKGIVKGKIIDLKTNEVLPYVNIIIKDNAKKVITGGITDDDGLFNISKIPFGENIIEIQYIGYKTDSRKLSFSDDKNNFNLGVIKLSEDTEVLEEVVVVAETSTVVQKIDRKVINIGKDLTAAGASATEIMTNIQSVSVDQQTGEIALRGNSNVRVLVDGKPTNIDPAQLLQQIPSASIKQIELITNPSAKYNPEGMSGIINIVLYKNSNLGFNGNVTSGVTFARTPKFNSAVGLNYKVGKINLYANYGLNTGKQSNMGYKNSFQENLENRSDFNFGKDNTSHLIKAGIDYLINDKNTLSFYTTQNLFYSDSFAKTQLSFVDNANDNILQINDSDKDSHAQTYNLDYKIELPKEGQNLELEINYNTTEAPEDALFFFNATDSRLDNIKNNRDNLLVNLDFENPISETANIEVGLESRIQNTENSLNSSNSELAASFDYDRTIYSGYANLNKQWGEKWTTQLGARLEQYNVDAVFTGFDSDLNAFTTENITDDIFSIYPSAFVSFAQSENNTFNLSYSRRVDRPSIGQVNPIRQWTTPAADSEGNPNLKPQFTNSYEFNYTRKTGIGAITAGVFYRQINDEISRSVTLHPTIANKLILSNDNFDENDAFGFEVSANLKYTNWWSSNISFDIYQKTIKGIVSSFNVPSGFEAVEIDNSVFNTRISNNFTATKNLRFQLSGMYSGENIGLQFKRNEMWKVDAGVSYNVLKGKGTISARSNDIFNTMNFSFEGTKPYRQQGEFNWESQSVYFGFSYRFGGGKNKALERKKRDNNEKQGGGGMM